jgi:hypothetical protein
MACRDVDDQFLIGKSLKNFAEDADTVGGLDPEDALRIVTNFILRPPPEAKTCIIVGWDTMY